MTKEQTEQILEQCRGLPREAVADRLRAEAPNLDLASRFRLLHELGVYWGDESDSGDGSSMAETRALREALPDLIHRHHVESILDVPCGDAHWMAQTDLGSASYLGADIVESLIARNQARHAGSGRSFAVLDLTKDKLPRADLILCRDLFIHLSLADIGRALRNIAASGSGLLLATHYAACKANVDIESGDFRPINLRLAPFHLPAPIEEIDERSQMEAGAYRDRSMALLPLDGVIQALNG